MKKSLIPIVVFLSAVLFLSTNAMGITITDPIIAFQPDANFDGTLSAQLDLTGSGDTLTVRLTNTTVKDEPIDYDFPSTILATGFGLNLGEYSIQSGSVSGVYDSNFNHPTDDANKYWGYGDTNNFNTPLEGSNYSVDHTVTTLSAYVDEAFAPGGIINGPSHGVLSEGYEDELPLNYPIVNRYIDFDLILDVPTGINWDSYIGTITSQDVVVSFGSPTAVPEPATMLLLGSGLLGLAGFRKKIFKK